MTRVIPDLLLERYRLGELPDPDAQAMTREIAGNPATRERFAALTRSDEEIRALYPAARFVRRAGSRRPSPRAWLLAGSLTAAVVTLLAVMPELPAGGDRIKGAAAAHASLVVYRRTPDGSERLSDGAVAHRGDLLRVGYAAGGRAYGVILSIDGRGTVTLHQPPAGDEAASLVPGRIMLLDSAYELDEAPRLERFYFVTGSRPFKVAPVLAAARASGAAPAALPLPPSLEQVTFTVHKEILR